jgi:hypothetical protein
MKSLFVGALCGAVVLCLASRSDAVPETPASGQFIENDAIFDIHHDDPIMPTPADAEKTLEDGSSFMTHASVKGPKLKVEAFASRPNTVESQYPRSGAEAIWEDDLAFANADLYLGVLGTFNPVAYFRPQAFGGGFFGGASFSAAVSYANGGVSVSYKSVNFSNTEPDFSLLNLNIPVVVSAIFSGAVTYRMDLSVGTQSTLAPGESAFVNYSHTAFLPPIYIGDANGNPIPQLAGLRLVGSSGLNYPVTLVQKTPGDYNGDGIVNAADYTVWRDTYGRTGLTLNADGDGDQIVGDEDYEVWQANFGTVASFGADLGLGSGAGAGLTVAPEPETLALFFVGAVGLAAGAGRRNSR